MEKVACLTFTQQLDGTWTWQAYDRHGKKLLSQDRCPGLVDGIEAFLTYHSIGQHDGTVQDKTLEPPSAKKSRARRSARKSR